MRTRIAMLALALALGTLSLAQDRPVVKFDASQIKQLSDQMNAMTGSNWQDGFAFGNQLADLPSPVGYMILRDNWNKGASIAERKQMFKGFVFNNHPDMLLVLNLGMRDPDPVMQAWSNEYFKSDFFCDFSDDYDGYLKWFNKNKARSITDVKKSAVRDALDAILSGQSVGIGRRIGAVSNAKADEIAAYPRAKQLVDKLASAPLDAAGADLISKLLISASLSEADMNGVLDKILAAAVKSDNDPGVLDSLSRAHLSGFSKHLMPLATDLALTGAVQRSDVFAALLSSGDPSAIPFVIDLLAKANKVEVPAIAMALNRTLGFDEDHPDPSWWQGWWARNKLRYQAPPDSDLPSFKIDALATADYIPDSDDVKDITDQSFLVGGDQMKRYIVSGKIDSSKTQDLLIVMPGGEGSIDFHPFVKRVFKHELNDNWILAQPVAPKWTNDENRVVWPSVNSPYEPAKFMMEDFLDGMIDELGTKGHAKIGKIYMLCWSSSGPSVYSYLANGKHEIEGAFIAMSIFNQGLIKGAKDLHVKRVFLLHSPDDALIPIVQAEEGRDELTRLGISVKMETYPGGHGWRGSVWELMDKGFAFLHSSP